MSIPYEAKKHVAFVVSEFSKQTKMAVNRGLVSIGADPVVVQRSWIMGYIYHESQVRTVCQKDLEKIFHMPKATLSDMLQVLEKNGLIVRASVENDARQKAIILTDEGKAFHQKVEEQIIEVEKVTKNDVSDEDFAVFSRVLETMYTNVTSFKSDISLCNNNIKGGQ